LGTGGTQHGEYVDEIATERLVDRLMARGRHQAIRPLGHGHDDGVRV
jgi:hypothetical protein